MFETIIDNFLYLYKQRPDLFADHQADLDHLVETLPAEAEAVADAISQWLENHPTLQDAILPYLEEGKRRGFLSDKTSAADSKRDYGELVRNQMRFSPPPPTPQSPQPPQPPQPPASKDEQTPPT